MQTSQEKRNTETTHFNSTPQSKLLVIERQFNVPVDKLYQAFTDSEAIKEWWWPKDLYADRVDLDFRVGGKMFINMKGYDKGGGGMVSTFEEIVENERLVMTDNFADDQGNAISPEQAQIPGEWPEVGYITFEFHSIDESTSGFKLSQVGVPNELQQDCIQGWTESFDKLEEYLAAQKH